MVYDQPHHQLCIQSIAEVIYFKINDIPCLPPAAATQDAGPSFQVEGTLYSSFLCWRHCPCFCTEP